MRTGMKWVCGEILLITSVLTLQPVMAATTWQQTGGVGSQVSSLAIDRTTPQTVYAGTITNGMLKSTNGGTSWSAVSSGLTNTWIKALAIDPTTPQTIYAGTYGSGVFKSTNGGTSWSAGTSG